MQDFAAGVVMNRDTMVLAEFVEDVFVEFVAAAAIGGLEDDVTYVD